jgi:hypothetical protein
MIYYVASGLAILGVVLFSLFWASRLQRMIDGCDHSAKVLDEAYATPEGEILISYVCDSCGERWQSMIWRSDPLGPPGLASDL